MDHFRPFNNVSVMSAFHPIAIKLLYYGKRRDGPQAVRTLGRDEAKYLSFFLPARGAHRGKSAR
jgi:hypothetical protein